MIETSIPLLLLLLAATVAVGAGLARIPPLRGRTSSAAVAILPLLLLAAVGVRVPGSGPPGPCVLLVDVSFSTGEAIPDVGALGREAGLDPARTRVYLFGARAVRLAGTGTGWPRATRADSQGAGRAASDLAAALGAVAPDAGPGGRIVVVTDGRVARGRLATVGAGVRSRGIGLAVRGYGRTLDGDARVDLLRVAGRLAEGERGTAIVGVAAPPGRGIVVRLVVDGREAARRRIITEDGGGASVRFALPALGAGRHEVEARVDPPPGDPATANDRRAAGVVVGGARRALLVGGTDAGPELRSRGFRVESAAPAEIPDPGPFDLMVLENVPATALPDGGRALRDAVRAGSGLLVLGGPRAFGPGGYSGRPIEDALPVRSDPGEEGTFVTVLMDRSGTMGRAFIAGGGEKLTAARAAARRLLGVLPDRATFLLVPFSDRVVGDSAPIRLGEPGGRERAEAEIAAVDTAHGGTALVAPLARARDAVRAAPGRALVLLLTDGRIEGESADEVKAAAAAVRAAGARLFVLAVGDDADFALLDTLAGPGASAVRVTSAGGMAQAFLAGLLAVEGKDRILTGERPVRAGPAGDDPHAGGLPPVRGLVRTWGAEGASIWRETGDGIPVVAGRRYGLGYGVAVATDPYTAWAPGWAGSGLVGDLAERAARPASLAGLRVGSSRIGDRLQLDLHLPEEEAEVHAVVSAAGAGGGEVDLPAAGPGRYRGEVPSPAAGAAFLSVGTEGGFREAGFSVPWPAEYGETGPDPDGLAAVRRALGVDRHPPAPGRDARFAPACLALLLLLGDRARRALRSRPVRFSR